MLNALPNFTCCWRIVIGVVDQLTLMLSCCSSHRLAWWWKLQTSFFSTFLKSTMPRVRRSLPAVPQRGFSEPMQQTLLVNDLLGCGNVKEAILIDLKDFSYVSATPNFAVSALDVACFHALFRNSQTHSVNFSIWFWLSISRYTGD